MKNLILLLALVSGGFISYGQSSLSTVTQTPPNGQAKSTETSAVLNGFGDMATLQKEVVNNTFKYTFQSDKILEPGKVDRWTARLEQQFPQLIELQLTSSTQTVLITLSDTHSEQDLLEIVQRFDYLNYSINE